jgi:hypothetical protein
LIPESAVFLLSRAAKHQIFCGPTEIQLSQLIQRGIFAVAEQARVSPESPIKAGIEGDEPDNAQLICKNKPYTYSPSS